MAFMDRTKTVIGFPEAKFFQDDSILYSKCDILIPTLNFSQIDEDMA